MPATTLRPLHRQPGHARRADYDPLCLRAALPALRGTWTPPLALPAGAAHDFLVPNPRPDLTTDPDTLRMIEVA